MATVAVAMEWRQRTLFAVLPALVTVGFLTGMAVVFGVLLSAENPVVDSTLPLPTVDPLSEDDFKSASCQRDPLPMPAILPQSCTTTYYDPGDCSDRLCTTESGICTHQRCCCQPYINPDSMTESSPITITCPKGTITLPPKVTACACQPCRLTLSILFIGSVIDNSGVPVIQLIVTVTTSGRVHHLATDKLGCFGLRLSAMESTITVQIHAAMYTSFEQSYQVIPGEENEIRIVLLRVFSRSLTPGHSPLFLSLYTLSTTTGNLSTLPGESFMQLPAGFFMNDTEYVFLACPVNVTSDESIRAYRVSMAIEVAVGRHQREVSSFREKESQDEIRGQPGGERRRKRQDDDEKDTIILIGIVFSHVSILDDGEPYEVPNNQVATISITSNSEDYSVGEASELTCYFFDRNDSRLYLASDTPVVRESGPGLITVEFQVSGLTFPLEYIIAFELRTLCYSAVRAFDEIGRAITTTVEALTRQDDDRVTVAYGDTTSCFAVPCEGTLTLKIVDTLAYSPPQIQFDLSEQRENPVYIDKVICEVIAFGSVATPKRYSQFVLATTSNDSAPTFAVFNTSEMAIPPFCFLSTEIYLCAGGTVEVVLRTPEEVLLMQIQSPNFDPSAVNDERDEVLLTGDEVGSGTEPPNTCGEKRPLCIQIPCFSQVSISTVQFTAESMDGESCTPTSNIPSSGDPNTVSTNLEVVVVELMGQRPLGVYIDDDRSIARLKCRRGSIVGVYFQCHSLE